MLSGSVSFYLDASVTAISCMRRSSRLYPVLRLSVTVCSEEEDDDEMETWAASKVKALLELVAFTPAEMGTVFEVYERLNTVSTLVVQRGMTEQAIL